MESAKPRVLLDVDGPLAAFVPAYLDLVRRELGIVATPEQVTGFDIGASLGLTIEQSAQVGRAIGKGFCTQLEVCSGAREGVKRLSEIAEIYVVTSPWWTCHTWMHERQQWLRHHFEIPASRIVHTSAKHLCRGDILVDDKTETLRSWIRENPDGVAVQWITPHNRLDGWLGRATDRWDELCAFVHAHGQAVSS